MNYSEINFINKIKLYAFISKQIIFILLFVNFSINYINGFINLNYYNNEFKLIGIINYIYSGLILLGIYAINRYNYHLTYIYNIYNIFMIIIKLSFLLNNSNNEIIFLNFLLLTINIYFYKFINKFIFYINILPDNDIEELIDGWKPNILFL